MRRALRMAERCLALVGAGLIVFHLGFDLHVIASGSMRPALADGDCVLVEKLTGQLRAAKRWEVLAFSTDDGINVMKRAIGLPGESVALAGGELRIDGSPPARPRWLRPLGYYAYGNLAGGRRVEAGPGYYVLGDDSKDSQDSRFEGPVPASRIQGRAWLVVWPPHRAGWVR